MVRNPRVYFHNKNTLCKSSKCDINIFPFTQQSEPPQVPEHTMRSTQLSQAEWVQTSNETLSLSELQFPVSDSPAPVPTSVQSRDAAQPHTWLSDLLVKRDRLPVQGLQSKRLPRNLKAWWVLISLLEKVGVMCQKQQLCCPLIGK